MPNVLKTSVGIQHMVYASSPLPSLDDNNLLPIHFMWSIVSGVLFPSLQHPKDDIQFLARWHCAIESQPINIFFHQTLL